MTSTEINMNSNTDTQSLDDILKPNPKRFTLFPIQHKDLWDMYKTQQASFWAAEELNLSTDLDDWHNKLNDNERYYIERILGFFAQADGIVNENLVLRFQREVQYPEAQIFYGFQQMMENIHAESYALFLDTYIDDREKREFLFNSIENIPCIKKKADWALRWIESEEASFGERLLAFACVEGIFFSGSFAAIFWLRKRGLLKGLTQANNLISRDEGLHQEFACKLYKDHLVKGKLPHEKVYQIVKEACELEKEFQTESLPCDLIGLNKSLMAEYIEYVSDFLLGMIGVPKLYNTRNPFDFMENISLDSNGNFFEVEVTEYRQPGSSREWTVDEDF